MARQATHPTELDRLFRTARFDVPSVAEQQRFQSCVLAALRSGKAPAPDLLDQSLGAPTTIGKLTVKLLTSLGVVAIVTLGVTQLRHHSKEVPPPIVTSDAPAASVVAASLATSVPVPHVVTSSEVEVDETTLPPTAVTRDPPLSAVHATRAKPLPSEASLIEQAHRELPSNPTRALALTETHRKLYPKGILAQEREVIAIDALARLGKARAAKQRGSAFRTQQPHSIHELRLRQALGDAGVGK